MNLLIKKQLSCIPPKQLNVRHLKIIMFTQYIKNPCMVYCFKDKNNSNSIYVVLRKNINGNIKT